MLGQQGQLFNPKLITMISWEQGKKHDLQHSSSVSPGFRRRLVYVNQATSPWVCHLELQGVWLRKRQRVSALKLEASRANLKLGPLFLGPNISGDPNRGGWTEKQAGSRPKERWAGVSPRG